MHPAGNGPRFESRMPRRRTAKLQPAARSVIVGNPDPAHISTSLIERQNLTMRMSMRRSTRLTNAFSKKVENLRAAVSLLFAHYNFVRVTGPCASRQRWKPG